MPPEDDDDLYDDEFDFVDDEDEDDEDERDAAVVERDEDAEDDDAEQAETEEVDDDRPPAPETNYVVHVYEHRQFKRTLDRPFTAEDAEAFSSEYNRTAKPYGRFAVAGKNDAKPRKSLD